MVLIVVMTIMIIVTHYLLEILFIGLHLVKIKIEDGTTTEPLSKRMLIIQIIHNYLFAESPCVIVHDRRMLFDTLMKFHCICNCGK